MKAVFDNVVLAAEGVVEERRGCGRVDPIDPIQDARSRKPAFAGSPAPSAACGFHIRSVSSARSRCRRFSYTRMVLVALNIRGHSKIYGQFWIAWSMESEVNHKQLADREFMRHFDLRMTHQQDADIWTPCLPGRSTWLSIQGSSIRKKTERHPTGLFRSDPIDRSGQNAFACALSFGLFGAAKARVRKLEERLRCYF